MTDADARNQGLEASQQAGAHSTGADSGGDLLAPLLPAGEPVESLLRWAQFFAPGGTPSPDFREVHREGGPTPRSW